MTIRPCGFMLLSMLVSVSTSAGRRWRLRLLGGITLLILVAVVANFYPTETPQSQLARIRQNRNASPAQSLATVRAILRSAQGDFPEAQILECQLLLRLQKPEEAKARFEAIPHPESCDPEQLAVLAELAQTAGDNDLTARALLATGDWIQHDPQRLKLLIFALYSHQGADEPEARILRYCDQYSELVPDDAFPWLIRSSLCHERGVPNMAVPAYREALKRSLPPDEAFRVRMQLVQLELLLGNVSQAREHCDALKKTMRDPASRKVVQGMHAEVLQREGKPAEALKVLDQLLAESPGWPPAQALRGRCRFELGDYAGAVSDLSATISRNEFDQQAHYILAQAYQKLHDLPRAKTHFQRSRELNEIGAKVLVLENQLRNDLYNRDLKLQLAALNEQLGNREKAAAWRRGAEKHPPVTPERSAAGSIP